MSVISMVFHARSPDSGVLPIKHLGVVLKRSEWLMMTGAFVTTIFAGILTVLQANAVLIFAVSGLALVGQATDQVGTGSNRGVAISAGQLARTFCWYFSLRAGLI